jgi:hypothetical protein
LCTGPTVGLRGTPGLARGRSNLGQFHLKERMHAFISIPRPLCAQRSNIYPLRPVGIDGGWNFECPPPPPRPCPDVTCVLLQHPPQDNRVALPITCKAGAGSGAASPPLPANLARWRGPPTKKEEFGGGSGQFLPRDCCADSFVMAPRWPRRYIESQTGRLTPHLTPRLTSHFTPGLTPRLTDQHTSHTPSH